MRGSLGFKSYRTPWILSEQLRALWGRWYVCAHKKRDPEAGAHDRPHGCNIRASRLEVGIYDHLDRAVFFPVSAISYNALMGLRPDKIRNLIVVSDERALY